MPIDPQAQAMGSTWPEQEAAEAWWRKYAGELKSAVTQERLRQQQEVKDLDKTIAGMRVSLDEQTGTINKLSDQIEDLTRLLLRFEGDASIILQGFGLERPPSADLSKKLLILRDEIVRLREAAKA